MNLHVIATGSSGNCYVLEGSSPALILEAGVTPERVFRACNISTRKVAGILITHEHGDHAGHVRRWLKLGFHVYMSKGTRDALRLEDSRYTHTLTQWTQQEIGDFVVRAFPAVHDAAEPVSYIIDHPDCGRILFATDTGRMDYTFTTSHIRHLLIEANYSDNIIDNNVGCGYVLPALARRIRESHLSLSECCDYVAKHNNADLDTVVLIHLSNDNADPAIFREQAAKNAPYADVYVADKGLLIPLNNLAM